MNDDDDLRPLDPEPGLESGSRRSRIVVYSVASIGCVLATIYLATTKSQSSLGFFIGLAPIAAVGFAILVVRAIRERP